MHHVLQHHLSRRAAVRALASMPLLLGTLPASALAKQPSTDPPLAIEAVLSTRRIGVPATGHAWVVSRVALPAGAIWSTDPDAGPLSLRVLSGDLVVTLEDGSARVERRFNLFLRPEIVPFPAGVPVTLTRGDHLTVVRGFRLTVTNDSEASASAIVSRLDAAPDGAA